jgi:hypothetical protein
MGSGLRNQIYSNLNSKDTEELLDIWKTNDRVEWSDLAFEVLEEILSQRVGSLPKQNEPIFEYDEAEEDDDLEDWEAKILDNENQPELYDTLEVIDTVDNINKVAKAVIVIYAFINLTNTYLFGLILRGMSPSLEESASALWDLFTTIITTTFQIAVVYFPLKALSHILKILMEMEFNSRKQ